MTHLPAQNEPSFKIIVGHKGFWETAAFLFNMQGGVAPVSQPAGASSIWDTIGRALTSARTAEFMFPLFHYASLAHSLSPTCCYMQIRWQSAESTEATLDWTGSIRLRPFGSRLAAPQGPEAKSTVHLSTRRSPLRFLSLHVRPHWIRWIILRSLVGGRSSRYIVKALKMESWS